MAVPVAGARDVLRRMLDGPDRGGTGAHWLSGDTLPDGTTTGPGGAPLPDPPPLGYRADATYAFSPDLAALLDRTPAEALALDADDLATYRAHGVDLTMRGGTTSGVVYPLAVCEAARHFRVRNVGGASAGAIAAAATAAAELGRRRLAVRSTSAGPTALEPGPGHVHPGYRGLADIVAWLTELDGPDGPAPAREQHRLASLFQPAPRTRGTWWLVDLGLRLRARGGPTLVAGIGLAVALLIGLLALGTAGWLLPDGVDLARGAAATVVVGLAVLAVAVLALAVLVLRLVGRAERISYGLVSGATPDGSGQRPLTTWLGDCLGELAGQPGTVLTFGDLWFGDGWRDRVDSEQVLAAARDSRRRLVNLELVTTDLTQQRSVRFPLRPGPPRTEDADLPPVEEPGLHVDRADLVELVGTAVADLVCAGPGLRVRVDGRELLVHPLPGPAELPVILAVRMSMALPGLLTAVRTYRLRRSSTVRDDLGAPLLVGGEPVLWPPPGEPPAAEVVWFSDGGITSNFPVQLFDSVLPQWPTFGLNLGRHPDGFERQDVWLPEDWQAGLPPAEPVGPSLLGFLGAVVSTARSWRDTAQTAMPSTRSRVAWVRQRPGSEGGTNLYMRRDVVASLALRGGLAGARLRQRFAGDEGGTPGWRRHRWLRLRAAVPALEAQRSRLHPVVEAYRPLLDVDPPTSAEGVRRYPPGPGFSAAASALLASAGTGPVGFGPAAPADLDAPHPFPELTPTPPL